MSAGPLLLANIGAEEGDEWRQRSAIGPVATLARLWTALFGAAARSIGPDGIPAAAPASAEPPVFPWLALDDAVHAWLNTAEAKRIAEALERPLAGPTPEVVARVHDKAFAHRTALSERLIPPSLRGRVEILEPELLREPGAAVAKIDAVLSAWPEAAAQRFTLKPRFGSSGRGRVSGGGGRSDTPEIRGALRRLADRGGALLEPWLERTADLSTQLYVSPERNVLLLGTLEQRIAPSGLFVGHQGYVDARGRVHAGDAHDEPLREPAALAAAAAAAEGYTGPCGVDAFAFRTTDGQQELRCISEFNARATVGLVVVGLLKRALPSLKAGIGIAAEERRAFHFALDAPDGGWPAADPRDGLQLVPLWQEGDASHPALLVGRTREEIDTALSVSSERE